MLRYTCTYPSNSECRPRHNLAGSGSSGRVPVLLLALPVVCQLPKNRCEGTFLHGSRQPVACAPMLFCCLCFSLPA